MSNGARQKLQGGIQPDRPVLGTGFFDRDAVTVARELIGKILAREQDGALTVRSLVSWQRSQASE